MIIKILYDNSVNKPLTSRWGFSCYLEDNKNKILFDTGWNGNILLSNMKLMDVQPDEIDKIVLSHMHWDHIGGLNHLLEYQNIDKVYVPQSFSVNLKNEIKNHARVIEVSEAQKVYENIYTTGELDGKIKEQSLVLHSKKGNIVLTGCAHPGLETIIEKSREFGDIYAVIGGFHDSNIDILKGIPLIVPCHCSQKVDEIKNKMPESFRECKTGCSLKI